MASADRVSGVVLFVLGIAMLTGGYTMDRLTIRQIHPLSIPGLVPMLLGGALAVCALILLWQSRPAGADGAGTSASDMAASDMAGSDARSDAGEPGTSTTGGSPARLALTTVLTVGYGAVLVGWLPFFWATAIFVSLFTLVFSWSDDDDRSARTLTVVKSVAFGGLAAAAVLLLFQEMFLVRLP